MSGRAWLPPVLWALLLLGIGSIPNVPGPETGLPLDKVAHLLMYGVLGVLLGGAWQSARGRPAAAVVLAAALLVGALDEINQSRIAGRSAELADWIMDAVGILAGFTLRLRLRRRRRRPRE